MLIMAFSKIFEFFSRIYDYFGILEALWFNVLGAL